ncbi:MAG: PD-(D/E)XK nuclease family transposase [Lachnospiraceae bacterium]
MKTFEEQKAFVSKFNVIDDVFFQKMAEDNEVIEEILQIILGKPKLKVIDSQVQRFLRNTGAHSVILDLICEDEDHSIINCEVQKEDDDDHQKRVRFNRSNIDTIFIEKGIDYKELPDVYMIFISKFDTFNEKKTIYHINRVIEETGTVVENGVHEIYVNTAIDDHTDIAELMQYFKQSIGEHTKFQKLCNRVKYFKESQKGVSDMCQIVEEYATKKVQQRDIEIATELLKNGASIDIIVNSIPSLTREFILDLSKKIES